MSITSTMKKIFFLSAFILFLCFGCEERSGVTEEQEPKTSIPPDNAELEEAKAISRKIFEGIEKVENEEASREEFQAYAKPLQEKLNSLIVIMEEQEVRELDRYRNELMDELSITDTATH
ncbi:hypothetical protein [Salinimicrobium marinum]|nr:hypothetical protein [Salinimicrobium marinum]